MTKQEEVNEMMLAVPQTIVAYDANPKGQHLYGEQRRQIAVALYDVGYRKIDEDSVVISREEYETLSNKYKNLEIKYSNLCDKYRLCKDANETLKQNVINAGCQKVGRLEAENERLKEVNRQPNDDYNRSLERLKSDCREMDELKAEVKRLESEIERLREVNRQLNTDYCHSLDRLIQSDCREIAQLKVENTQLKAKLEARLTCEFVKTAQKQAIQEFANKL